jgi:hypothetical protein
MLMHRWSYKAIVEVLAAMTGLKLPQLAKDLTKEFEESWYRNVNGACGLPCRIVKASIAAGARETNGTVGEPTMKKHMRVVGEFSTLHFDGQEDFMQVVEMDVRPVRVGPWNDRVVDMRARALIPAGAYCDVVLDFGGKLTVDQVITAAISGGLLMGCCDSRPEKGGDYGTYEVEPLPIDATTISSIISACAPPEHEYKIPPELLHAVNAVPEEEMSDKQRKARALLNGSGAAERVPEAAE